MASSSRRTRDALAIPSAWRPWARWQSARHRGAPWAALVEQEVGRGLAAATEDDAAAPPPPPSLMSTAPVAADGAPSMVGLTFWRGTLLLASRAADEPPESAPTDAADAAPSAIPPCGA